MLHFYDGQIRRYITQVIRVLSNFTVKYGDGTLVRVPVMYGDSDRQAASIIRQNSENKINSVPRISVYISGLDMDKERLSDSTFVGNVHVREREINNTDPNNPVYTTQQGRNYTVERLMPTPFKLTLKCDIWTANTDQKMQLLEQILVLFNPSLELQTTDNYIDWTSLSVLNLGGINWSSKQVPVGTDTPIDVATLTLDTPIWISPPVKVKHLGVIRTIITSMYQSGNTSTDNYIDGLGQPLGGNDITLDNVLSQQRVSITNYNIEVYNNQAIVLGESEDAIPREITLEVPTRQGSPITWDFVFNETPGQYVAGSSTIYLVQPNGAEIIGTIAISPLDPTVLQINWDTDTRPADTDLTSPGDRSANGGRTLGTFDAIIDPQKIAPGHGMTNVVSGDRFLIVEDIGNTINQDGPDAWKSNSGADFVAQANDIIEWDGSSWQIIFSAAHNADTLLYQTNIYSGVQYVWNGVYWAKSFEGVYPEGKWRIVL